MKTVLVLYFAALREQRGLHEEHLDTEANTPRELYAELYGRYSFSLPPERLRVAVNDTFCPWDTGLREGDAVAFIPPVAGG